MSIPGPAGELNYFNNDYNNSNGINCYSNYRVVTPNQEFNNNNNNEDGLWQNQYFISNQNYMNAWRLFIESLDPLIPTSTIALSSPTTIISPNTSTSATQTHFPLTLEYVQKLSFTIALAKQQINNQLKVTKLIAVITNVSVIGDNGNTFHLKLSDPTGSIEAVVHFNTHSTNQNRNYINNYGNSLQQQQLQLKAHSHITTIGAVIYAENISVVISSYGNYMLNLNVKSIITVIPPIMSS